MKPHRYKDWLCQWWLLLLPASTATFAVLAYAYTFHALPATQNPIAWGTFGDYMGGLLNPLVSVLTLFVAISVWRLQKEELERTSNELAQTRQEQRFFDLLNVYYKTVNCISFTRIGIGLDSSPPERFEGKLAISAWLRDSLEIQEFARSCSDVKVVNDQRQKSEEIQHMDRMLNEWRDSNAKDYFNSYFRVVKHLLSEAQHLLGDQHERYIALFCSQLSVAETVILAFHLWLDSESADLLDFACSYRLLRDLPNGDLRTELKSEFPGIY